LDAFIISACLVSGLYFFMIFRLIIFWFKRENCNPADHSNLFITVVIPFRNEEKNLPVLLASLQKQSWRKESFEVIFIDDHSEDNSARIIKNSFEENYVIISLSDAETGKKTALKNGFSKARGQMIVTTDADCSFGSDWLSSFAQCYISSKPAMIAGPVDFVKPVGFFEKIQNLEFLSLVGTGASSINSGYPIFCNAANMAFDKKEYQKLENPLFDKHSSGDDVFLLHGFAKAKKKIVYLNHRDSVVWTQPPAGISGFISQRKRWASKSRYYREPVSIITAIIVFITSLAFLSTGFASFFSSVFLLPFLLIAGSKTIIDAIFLFQVTGFFNKRYLLWLLIPMQPLYVVYVSFIGIFGNTGTINWKGRKI